MGCKLDQLVNAKIIVTTLISQKILQYTKEIWNFLKSQSKLLHNMSMFIEMMTLRKFKWIEFYKALKKTMKKINKKIKKKKKPIKKNKITKIKQKKFMKKKKMKKKKNRFRNPLNKKIKAIYRWILREINFFNMSHMNK